MAPETNKGTAALFTKYLQFDPFGRSSTGIIALEVIEVSKRVNLFSVRWQCASLWEHFKVVQPFGPRCSSCLKALKLNDVGVSSKLL